MGLFETFGDMARGASKSASESLFRELQDRYPGLSPEHVRAGWIPVPIEMIRPLFEQRVKESCPQVQDAAMEIANDVMSVAFRTEHFAFIKSEIKLDAAVERFVLTSEEKTVVLKALSDIDVKGRNLAGSVLKCVIRAVIAHALRQSGGGRGLKGREDNATYELDWPLLTIDLGMVPEVTLVTDDNLVGIGVLMLFDFGPLRLRTNRVEIKITPKALGSRIPLFGG